MSIEIKAPQFPESIVDGEVLALNFAVGDQVKRDQILVEIETDKVVLEVLAPENGTILSVSVEEGDTVASQQVIATLEAGEITVSAPVAAPSKPAQAAPAPVEKETTASSATPPATTAASPAARKMMDENRVDPSNVVGTGKGGRITKADVTTSINPSASTPAASNDLITKFSATALLDRDEKRVPMTRLRKRIAERLVTAQQTAAMLTTFNEVNMKPVIDMRNNYQKAFQDAYDVKLGYMSFFVRAAVEALKRFPTVNASIDGDEVVYHGYYDIGVAVSSERGLVVPIIRDANHKGFAETEAQIIEYGEKARSGQLSIDDMQGGTFTISNGGIFGSMLSTPILNPPQTAILGMHKIQDRPMAVDGEVVILPMMYLALTYDHRLIDGKEAVQFLATIKNFLEDPARLLLDI